MLSFPLIYVGLDPFVVFLQLQRLQIRLGAGLHQSEQVIVCHPFMTCYDIPPALEASEFLKFYSRSMLYLGSNNSVLIFDVFLHTFGIS